MPMKHLNNLSYTRLTMVVCSVLLLGLFLKSILYKIFVFSLLSMAGIVGLALYKGLTTKSVDGQGYKRYIETIKEEVGKILRS